ncbi:hypothetical protein K3G63_21425 [Hymenobacter sp. HSC-4F20]|uniref:hypothetical protein n=1 Tax=Hymenobacter sp. HSC-4F20 TaxID=2864135 RepID=UPI001C736852|nr:hypothetical protein [Hymenobacter sp. HSC-4F20]MBX0293019.1 hypothetical protein [Hymenobacter sp. HSC-4F20]
MHFLTLLLRPLCVVTLCAGATSALAQASGAISLTQVAPTALRLRIENPTALPGSVQVVRLSSRQTLFSETYTVPAYGHRFDFRHVPSGRYLVRLQAGGQVYRCLVRVQTQDQGSSMRVNKLTSRAMPATVVVKNLAVSSW